jgi:glutamate formiminotransferase
LKALGLLVGEQAQVSMNVIDFRQMPLFTIMETLRAEAHKHGVSITRTELVGLIPQKALIDYALASLQLPPETRDLVLEVRLGEAMGDFREVKFE